LKGDSNLATLITSTNLSGKLVREALFVLIQHSIVTFTTNPISSVVSSGSSLVNSTLYHLEVEAILCRIAYGQVVARVAETVSVRAADLLLDVMVAGRLNVSEHLKHKPEEDRLALKTLLSEGFIEIIETGEGGVKRKLSPDSPEEDTYVRFKATWIVTRMIFCDRLVELVTKKLNASAGKIVETIFELIDPEKEIFSQCISFGTLQLSQKLPKDLALPLEKSVGELKSPLLQYLQVLAQNFDFIEAQTSLGANAFSLNLSKALRHVRLVLMESFIRARFGVASARIFRILLTKRMFEERQIAKVAMITSKEVRERLFALLKFGLVHLQEVPKSADHAPSRTIFLWSLSEKANYSNPLKSAFFRNFASKFTSALVNLRDLTVLEKRKHAQLLEKVERSDVANNLDLLSPAEQKQLADLRRILLVLNVKIGQVFNEFSIFMN
jgi:hypothetical protein